MSEYGIVYLVGAGPGEPDLISVKGLNVIKIANVIIYDNLIDKRLLSYAPLNCELIYVGKKASNHTLSQKQINQLLIEKAKTNKVVVRLKGGDPFIFGRGGEEALVLMDEAISFEVIPGIPAAVGASAYAGIPLTHRNIASSVAFVTGHEADNKSESSINWEHLSKSCDTIVFYMAVSNLSLIVEKLIVNGRAGDTPVAIINNGTLSKQKVIIANLNNIIDKANEYNIKPPSLILVGDVVNLRDKLNWFEKKPLSSKRIMITRNSEVNNSLSYILSNLGAEVIEFSTIQIAKIENNAVFAKVIKNIDKYDWIIFTSQNAVKIFFESIFEMEYDIRILKDTKIASIGSVTTEYLNKYYIIPDVQPIDFVSENIINAIKGKDDINNKNILIPRSSIGRESIVTELKHEGAIVDDIPIYNTELPEYSIEIINSIKQRIIDKEIDWVTFTSSSTVDNYIKLLSNEFIKDHLNKVRYASIGPITSNTMKKYGLKVDLEASTNTIQGIVEKLLHEENK